MGMAAFGVKGETIHSFAGLGVPQRALDFILKKPSKIKINVMRICDVLFVDEISMVSGEFLDRFSERLQKFRKNEEPFGGC